MAAETSAGTRRLRVLHIGKYYPPHWGGIESYTESLCLALQDRVDFEVLVANDGRVDCDEKLGGVHVQRLATWLKLASAPICPGLAWRIRKTPADIVHLHHPNPFAVLAYLASGHPGKLVISYHSDIVRQKILGAFFMPILGIALRRASAIIATSRQYVDSSAVLRKYSARCVVIPLSIDPRRFEERDEGEVSRIRERFGPRLLLAVGRLVSYKGFGYLIEAMSRVNGRLLLIGDGPLRQELETLVLVRGLRDRVSFLSNVSDLRPYYQAADVFVLPSITRAEAFGIVQLEAMACGVPVVNTALATGVQFVSPDGLTGMTVPPGDSAALAGAINRLVDDRGLCDRLGSAGRQRVFREFSLGDTARRTLDLYARVARG
ncbi:MAG: glycosyltransferase [Elusimicrobia bacterium]|nr:glycosyltransferase [Elusimicrobiota bacterium]